MSILINHETTVICQGITGRHGTFHVSSALAYGTNVVGGVTPGRGGYTHLGLPVFNSVYEAVSSTGALVSMICVAKEHALDAMYEASDAGIKLIVCITEGIPILDMLKLKRTLSQTLLIGPNSSGIITPGECKIGVMPGHIFKSGCVGIVSKSGTLLYEAVHQLTSVGLGQSTCVCIGGDSVKGMGFPYILDLFNKDPQTKIILLIGEVGGNDEQEAAAYIQSHVSKPVFSFIAGKIAPKERPMGHAGALIQNQSETAQNKIESLKSYGVMVIESIVDIGYSFKNFFIGNNSDIGL